MTTPYVDLRERTQARDRSLREKVMSLEEATELVGDGDHVALGGCTLSRTPLAMIWALIRAKKKNLTVSRSIVSNEGDLLFASGSLPAHHDELVQPGNCLGCIKGHAPVHGGPSGHNSKSGVIWRWD